VSAFLGPTRHRLVQIRELQDLLVQRTAIPRIRAVDRVHPLAELLQLLLERRHDRIHLLAVHLGEGSRLLLHELRSRRGDPLLEEPRLLLDPDLLLSQTHQQVAARLLERRRPRRELRNGLALAAVFVNRRTDRLIELADARREAFILRERDPTPAVELHVERTRLIKTLPQRDGRRRFTLQLLLELRHRSTQALPLSRHRQVFITKFSVRLR
jgi:hypothetical protein